MSYRPNTSRYVCATCGYTGVKLWREIHDGSEGWCADCACARVGIPNDIERDGTRIGEYSRTDQLYDRESGLNLLPWVITEDGIDAYGYGAVPPSAARWWRALPLSPILDPQPVSPTRMV